MNGGFVDLQVNIVRQMYEVTKFVEEYDAKRLTYFIHTDLINTLGLLIGSLDFGFERVDIITSDSFPIFEYEWIQPKGERFFDWGNNYEILACLGLGSIKFDDNKIWYRVVKRKVQSKNYTICREWEVKSPTKYNTPIITHLCGTKTLILP